jgi:2-polyprenyl-6-methoxyphenol hydroxylase-like FAD-dependent oxidoreductase
MHDVIIVGTRAAGAATALLLARRGLNVLALDRATFPSDTLSTHQVQVPGTARLARWGLLDTILGRHARHQDCPFRSGSGRVHRADSGQ